MLVEARDIASVFGGDIALGRPVTQLSDLEKIVVEGLPFGAIENAFRIMSPAKSDKEMHVLLHVVFRPDESDRYDELRAAVDSFEPQSVKTNTRLRIAEGERAERLARIYALAFKAIGDRKLASKFLFSPHAMLGDATPLEKLETEIGAREVEDILAAAIFGLPT
jgi:putative toxin-antitoxin system antitoxin component (TIGR02293 family)